MSKTQRGWQVDIVIEGVKGGIARPESSDVLPDELNEFAEQFSKNPLVERVRIVSGSGRLLRELLPKQQERLAAYLGNAAPQLAGIVLERPEVAMELVRLFGQPRDLKFDGSDDEL